MQKMDYLTKSPLHQKVVVIGSRILFQRMNSLPSGIYAIASKACKIADRLIGQLGAPSIRTNDSSFSNTVLSGARFSSLTSGIFESW